LETVEQSINFPRAPYDVARDPPAVNAHASAELFERSRHIAAHAAVGPSSRAKWSTTSRCLTRHRYCSRTFTSLSRIIRLPCLAARCHVS